MISLKRQIEKLIAQSERKFWKRVSNYSREFAHSGRYD